MEWCKKLDLENGDLDYLKQREDFSLKKIEQIRQHFGQATHLNSINDLSIYATGSYGRLEGGRHSDVDLFFVATGKREDYPKFNLPKIQMMSEIININESMGFPPFSNDGEFLNVLFVDKILENLGGSADDYENHFTARMLLLLESRPLSNDAIYRVALEKMVESYFRDYPHHPKDFKPTFLTNDIIRFWKTLCLNYENRRNALDSDQRPDPVKKRNQQIRNYKLKFSRMLTCFATIGNLSTFDTSIEPKDVVNLCGLTPINRLAQIAEKRSKAKIPTENAIKLYADFLQITARSPDELRAYFEADENRKEVFNKAEQFGDAMFDVLASIHIDPRRLRYLII
jgi:hypothetical protein